MHTRVTGASRSSKPSSIQIEMISEAMEHDGPVVVDFIVEQEENVYPMIPSGMTVYDMIEEPVSEKVTS